MIRAWTAPVMAVSGFLMAMYGLTVLAGFPLAALLCGIVALVIAPVIYDEYLR